MNKSGSSVLIVDDEGEVRDLLESILENAGYRCTTSVDAGEAVSQAASGNFDIAFIAIRKGDRPVKDLMDEFRSFSPETAVIMITALSGAEEAIECIRAGAFDYIVKPFNLSQVLVAAERAMEKRRMDVANREFQKYLEQIAEDRAAETHRLFYSVTQLLVRLLELRVPFDVGHSVNVAAVARQIAHELKMTKDGVRKVYLAALLHDVGMIPVEDPVLNKEGALTSEEYRQIQAHSALAESVLKPVMEDEEVLKYIRHHHERYDGAGYPDGLRGNIIPLGARIISVAEAFDAMTRSRPYRKALPPQTALAELQRCADSQFDPQVVMVFSQIFDQVVRDLRLSATEG